MLAFGYYDIDIYSDNNTNSSPGANFPHSYNDTTGKGSSIFSSNLSTDTFQVSEMEVFRVR